ncbi:MAG: nitrophenyl compound nitroreductase subunit ArsF family protein [Elusimicrobia bacterium]|nr:nitrophenyl compound nitroreductase subunit ArsF family protein [Elusimicrobiota bacterium]
MKRLLGWGLLAFAGLSVVFAVYQERRPVPQVPAAPAPPAAQAKAEPRPAPLRAPKKAERRVVIARYCHGHARCSNCVKIEQYSREAIETGLRKALDSGRLRFEVVDVEESAHRHYIQDYGLYTKSLVLVSEAGGKETRHKVLNGVWDHLGDKTAFMAYVREETESFLE